MTDHPSPCLPLPGVWCRLFWQHELRKESAFGKAQASNVLMGPPSLYPSLASSTLTDDAAVLGVTSASYTSTTAPPLTTSSSLGSTTTVNTGVPSRARGAFTTLPTHAPVGSSMRPPRESKRKAPGPSPLVGEGAAYSDGGATSGLAPWDTGEHPSLLQPLLKTALAPSKAPTPKAAKASARQPHEAAGSSSTVAPGPSSKAFDLNASGAALFDAGADKPTPPLARSGAGCSDGGTIEV